MQYLVEEGVDVTGDLGDVVLETAASRFLEVLRFWWFPWKGLLGFTLPETNILLMAEIPFPTTWDGAKTL